MDILEKIDKYLSEGTFKEKRGEWKNEKIFLFGVKGSPITFEFALTKAKASKIADEDSGVEEEEFEELGVELNKQVYLLAKQDSGQPIKKSEFFSSVEEAAENLVKNAVKGNSPLVLVTFGEEIDEVIKGIQSAGKKKVKEAGSLMLFK